MLIAVLSWCWSGNGTLLLGIPGFLPLWHPSAPRPPGSLWFDTVRVVHGNCVNYSLILTRQRCGLLSAGMLDAYEVRITHPEIANNELFSFFNSVDLNEDGLLTLSEYRDYIESTM